MLTARVAVEKAVYHFDKLYDYAVPSAYQERIAVGCRVLVPFGAGNRRRQGVVLGLAQQEEEAPRKPIALLLDEQSLLTSEQLELVRYLKAHTFCTYYDAVKTLLPTGLGYQYGVAYRAGDATPPNEAAERIVAHVRAAGAVTQERLCEAFGLVPNASVLLDLVASGCLQQEDTARRRVGDDTVTMARLAPGWDASSPASIRLTAKQRTVVALLEEVGAASVREIGYFTGTTSAVVKALNTKGVVELFHSQVFRTPRSTVKRVTEPVELTARQQEAYQGLMQLYHAGKPAVSLLYGVTGSGKTSVFLRMIEDVVRDGRGVIVLVPEISLTPQTTEAFISRFGERVAILHSSLSMGERMDEWRRIREGRVDIAVGTRSAVFAPFERLGLIVLDEEQEGTYRSEQSPRYHAREVAKVRALQHHAQVLLCSATPSVESFYFAKTGRYHLFTLEERYGTAQLPHVEVVDMDAEWRDGNVGEISAVVAAELAENLRRGEQSILLLNRRGYHTLVKCSDCGTAVSCPHCSISLTYHQANGRLMCHYCGYSRDLEQKCAVCGGEYACYSGAGTQKLEEEIHTLLPAARVLRMDADTTMAKDAYEQSFGKFERGEFDIMVGTQMVAKGLNFPRVTLVGVLAADGSLNGDHFKSAERTFSLLTQVVGRCGRGSLCGRAYIQSHFPEHPIFALAAAQDFARFYTQEIATRQLMLYPPFCQLCAVGFAGLSETDTAGGAHVFFKLLTDTAAARYPQMPLRVLGPTPAAVSRVAGKYRYKIIIKSKNTKEFRTLLAVVLHAFGKAGGAKNCSVYADPYFDGSL